MTPANTGSQIPSLMQYNNEVQWWLDWGTGLRGTGMDNRRWAAQDQAALYLLSDCWDTVAITPFYFHLGQKEKKQGKDESFVDILLYVIRGSVLSLQVSRATGWAETPALRPHVCSISTILESQ